MAAKTKTEVATVDETETEIVEISDEEAALIAENQAADADADFIVPIAKLAQPLTEEVTNGDARPGQFILSLTGETFEPGFEFIVAGKGKGRFKPGKDGARTLVSYDSLVVPESWGDDPFVGQPFSEHPDAEEQYSKRVEAKEIEWGKGPAIQTTYNYTGYIVGSEVPVRISLRRTSAPAARKIDTLLGAVMGGQFWAKPIIIGSEQKKNSQGAFYVVTASLGGRTTTKEERQKAVKLAGAMRRQSIAVVGEEGDSPIQDPGSNGGLDV